MVILFDKFKVFKNKYGEFEVANENEIILKNRYTGVESKCDLNAFVHMIKTVFPDKKEQKELLERMFQD